MLKYKKNFLFLLTILEEFPKNKNKSISQMKKYQFFIYFILLFGAKDSWSQTVLITENFGNYQGTLSTKPAGWYFSSNANYTSSTFSGPSGPNSYKFGTNNTSIVSPGFSKANNVSFWIRGASTDVLSSLIVFESKDSINWDTLAQINPIPTTGRTYCYPVKTNTIHLKYTYKKSVGNLALDDFLLTANSTSASLPLPDHIVILVLENHGYNQIIGSSAAPYINGLANAGALFTRSYALSHPSQPNYLELFSGCNQGVTSDVTPSDIPFQTPNLGAALLSLGKTFVAFSENLPSTGFIGDSSGNYFRKHAPWVNWQGNGVNGIPSNLHLNFSNFPTNFNLLPTISFVIPNINNDMHNGTDPTKITICDDWIKNNLGNYISWANMNNSLFILTFDEDDNLNQNHIATLFSGEMVNTGQYTDSINHYTILRTLEEIYQLPYSCQDASVPAISNCWKIIPTGINSSDKNLEVGIKLFPNPASNEVSIKLMSEKTESEIQIVIYDLKGAIVLKTSSFKINKGEKLIDLNLSELENGIYFIEAKDINNNKLAGVKQKLVILK